MLSIERWWLVTAPMDLRYGMDRLLGHVRLELKHTPTESDAYVFVNRARTRIKLLCFDRHGVWLATRRLYEGGFKWPRDGDTTWRIDAEQFAWLCAGVNWQRLSVGPMALAKAV
jgi:transposase